jgi:hypothetical protein
MFGFCRDEFTRELHKRGYCIVPMADASIRARELVGRQGRELFRLGDLVTLFDSDVLAPNLISGITAAPIDVTETGAVESRLGALFVARWIGSDKAGLGTRLRSTRYVKIHVGQVQKEYVELGALDSFLAMAQLRGDGPTIIRLMSADSLYVVTAVLKAPSMTIESRSGDLIGADLQVTEVYSGVAGSLKAQSDDTVQSRIVFNADTPVAFAFQAAKLLYLNGRYISLNPDRSNLVIMGDNEFELDDEERLVDEIGRGMPLFAAMPK